MLIFVKTWTGKTITMDVKAFDTTADLKYKIQDKMGLTPCLQRVAFQGRALEDGRALSDFKVLDESTVSLFMRFGHKCSLCENVWGRMAQRAREDAEELERKADEVREAASELDGDAAAKRHVAVGLERVAAVKRKYVVELEREAAAKRETAAGLEREAAAELAYARTSERGVELSEYE
jgi:ubiquitin C